MAPALCGPTRSAPPPSNHAIEPPPAPMVWTSTEGMEMGSVSRRFALVIGIERPGSTHTSKLVPPVSMVMMSALSVSSP